jgi:pimeloyl-ACP methyl ester carboxylesterase
VSHRWAFRGIDPEDLALLCARLQDRSEVLDAAGRRGASLLREHGLVTEAAALGRTVSGVAVSLAEASADTRWRVAAIRNAQDTALAAALPILAWRIVVEEAEFAATVACPPDARDETLRGWRACPPPEALADLSPAQVAAAFATMSPLARDGFALRFPDEAAALAGAPAEVRFLANRLRIADHVADLEDRLSSLRRRAAGGEAAALEGEIGDVEGRIRELRRWITEERQILWFDPAGDGRVIEVFGDLDAARHVAVVVPGVRNDLAAFSDRDRGFRHYARDLAAEVTRLGGGSTVATIAWLGYDPPDGLDAASRAAAEAGEDDLARFVDLVDLEGDRHVTVIGHSYGSVVAGLATSGGLDADEVVFVGSPGTGLGTAAEARLRPGGRVWAAIAIGDPIGRAIDPLAFLGGATDDLWYGPDPTDRRFGATRFATSGATGHFAYFDPDTASLGNLALIVAGRGDEVKGMGG